MTRLLLLLPILGAACGVGEYGASSSVDGMMGTDDKERCDPRGQVGQAHNHAVAGANPAGARSGMGCLTAGGCHGVAQPGSTVFAFAGTAYKELGGTTINAGATVRVFPRGTKKSVAKAVTDDGGNFYVVAGGGTFNQFPYEVDITACGSTPDIIPMIGTIGNAGEANCASSGACHAIPGTRGIYINP